MKSVQTYCHLKRQADTFPDIVVDFDLIKSAYSPKWSSKGFTQMRVRIRKLNRKDTLQSSKLSK